MVTRCDWWGYVGEPMCVWCPEPLAAHRWVCCSTCDGSGLVEGFDVEMDRCPDDGCQVGRVANPAFEQEAAA